MNIFLNSSQFAWIICLQFNYQNVSLCFHISDNTWLNYLFYFQIFHIPSQSSPNQPTSQPAEEVPTKSRQEICVSPEGWAEKYKICGLGNATLATHQVSTENWSESR